MSLASKGKHMNLKNVKSICLILAGNTLYALAVASFVLPNGLMTGGTTGLALFIRHFLPISVSSFVGLFNIAMFLLGAWVLGKRFAVTTLISTFYYPFILMILEQIPALKGFTDNSLLAVIYAGLMIGAGIGMVIKEGASTGGMDIPPLVLNKKFGVSISGTLYLLDFTILGLQMIFSHKEQILYGILLVLIYTIVLEQFLLLGKSQIEVKIITEKFEEVNAAIIKEMDRGTTFLETQTGYLRNHRLMILTVISRREMPRLNRIIQAVDPQAFIMISKVNEVRGHGFTSDKIHKPNTPQ